MIKKLHYQFNLATLSIPRSYCVLAPMLIILLYLGGRSDFQAGGPNSYDAKNVIMI